MNSSLCSHCGEKILPHWTLCPVCALPFADAVTRRSESSDNHSIEPFDGTRYDGLNCVQCRSAISPDAQICPKCHVLIVRRYCSGCSRLIPDQATLCPYCSTPASAKRSRVKFYLQSAMVLMVVGSVVAGLLFLVYGIPGSSNNAEAPLVVAPPPEPALLLNTPKVGPLQLIPERFPKEEQPLNVDGPPPLQVTAPESRDYNEAEPSVEGAEMMEQPEFPAEETISEEPKPAEGEWQNRGAKLKQGRKLTIRASQLMQQGRYTEASIVLKDAISMFPEKTKDLSYGEALYKLGICLRRKGHPEQAIPVLREAMQFPFYRSKVLREVEAATGQLQRAKVNQTRG